MGAPIFVIEQGKQTEHRDKYWREEYIAPGTQSSSFWCSHILSSSEPLPEIREALQNQVLHLVWTQVLSDCKVYSSGEAEKTVGIILMDFTCCG